MRASNVFVVSLAILAIVAIVGIISVNQEKNAWVYDSSTGVIVGQAFANNKVMLIDGGIALNKAPTTVPKATSKPTSVPPSTQKPTPTTVKTTTSIPTTSVLKTTSVVTTTKLTTVSTTTITPKLIDGKTCTQDSNCQSAHCGYAGVSSTKLCFALKTNGNRCNANTDCLSEYCVGLGSQKTCQCKPNCGTGLDMKNCGADGCGGVCGTCITGYSCDNIQGKCNSLVAGTMYASYSPSKPKVYPNPITPSGTLCLAGVDGGEWSLYNLGGDLIDSGDISVTGATKIYLPGGLPNEPLLLKTPTGIVAFTISSTGSPGGSCSSTPGVPPVTTPPIQTEGWVKDQYKCEVDKYNTKTLYQLYQYFPAGNGIEADIEWKQKEICRYGCDEINGGCALYNANYPEAQVNKCTDNFESTFTVTRGTSGETYRGSPRPCVLNGQMNYCNPASGNCFETLHTTKPGRTVVLEPTPAPVVTPPPIQIPTIDGTYWIFSCIGGDSHQLRVSGGKPTWIRYQTCLDSCSSATGLCTDAECVKVGGEDIYTPGVCSVRSGRTEKDVCNGESLREYYCKNQGGGFICDFNSVRCPNGNCIKDPTGFGYCEPATTTA